MFRVILPFPARQILWLTGAFHWDRKGREKTGAGKVGEFLFVH